MTNSRTVRITKPSSLKLVQLKKMTGLSKCRIIENALKNYIPFKEYEDNKK